jgi:YVTN family beta-propeller protein
VHDVPSGTAQASGGANTSTTASDSAATADPRDGIVQSSGGAITSILRGADVVVGGVRTFLQRQVPAGHQVKPNAHPVEAIEPEPVATSNADTPLSTAFDAPTSSVSGSGVVSGGADTESPLDAGPTHDLTALSVTPESTSLALPVVINAPQPPKPTTVVSRFVSSMLAWAGLSPDASKTPTAPVESPALWGILAWARRQFAQAMSDNAGMAVRPLETSLAIAELNPTPNYQLVASVPIGTRPTGVGVSPDGTRVYVADRFTREVWVVDTSTDTVVAKIPMGAGPNGVTVSADGTRAYVGLHGTNRVAVIDTATDTVIGTVKVGPGVTQVAVTPDGSRAYATNTSGRTVSVIDTATNTEIARVTVGGGPTGLVASPDGSRIYVANRSSNTVSVIDTATNTVIGTVKVGSAPRQIVIAPDGSRAYVTNDGSNNVSVIDTATNTVVATVPVGKAPVGVGMSPDGTLVYAANSNGTVSVIDTTTDTVVDTFSVGPQPRTGDHYMAVGADGTVYVVDETGRVLRVIAVS